jgi:hypothetical protein
VVTDTAHDEQLVLNQPLVDSVPRSWRVPIGLTPDKAKPAEHGGST